MNQLRNFPRRFFYLTWIFSAGIFTSAEIYGNASTEIVTANEDSQYTEMSLEKLMSLDIFSSASFLPTSLSKAPGTVYSFNRQDFQRYGVRTLAGLLERVPGFQLNQYRKRHQSLWARGILDRYNDKMILLVDGVQSQHLYYRHFSLGESNPLENIEKVEVILGPASSLYGANAFAGIISLTTRQFSEPTLELNQDFGDNQRRKTSLNYANRQWQFFASHLSQDAPFRTDRKSFIGGQVLQPLDETYKTFSVKYRPFSGLTLSANYNENDTPFLFIPSTQDAFIEEKAYSVNMFYEVGNLEGGKWETKVYYQKDKAREFEKEISTQSLGYEEHQNSTMAGASLTGFKRLQSHTVAIGADWSMERADKTNFKRLFHFRDGFLPFPQTGNLLSEPGIRNDDYAFFVEDVWDINSQWNLTLSGRLDKFDNIDNHFNYRSALIYTPADNQVLKLLYGTGIRTPSMREYLKVLENTSFKPTIPKPESIDTLELGYLYQTSQFNLGINVFRNVLEDFIREFPTPDFEDEYFANSRGTIYMQGAEVTSAYSPFEDLEIKIGLAYLDTEDIDGKAIPYVARWMGSFNIDYELGSNKQLGLSLVYNSDRPDTNSHQDDADDYVITNIHVSGPLSAKLSYQIGIDNLFDSKIHDPAADFGGQYNTEKSERELWVRLRWSPNWE